MKSFKRALAVLLCVIMTFGTVAVGGNGLAEFLNTFSIKTYAESYENLTYEINNEKVKITGCNKSTTGEVIIPSQIDGYSVTSISSEAFNDCMRITKLVVPNSVTGIEVGAFKGMISLEELQVPFVGTSRSATTFNAVLGAVFSYKTIISYEDSDKWSNESTDFTFKKVGSFDNGVWQYSCHNYKSSYVNNNSGTYYYRYLLQSYYYYIPSSLTKVTITNDYDISVAAFMNCNCLETISINNAISTINEYAFYNCSNLKNATLPYNLSSIGKYAFSDCSSLESIQLGSSLTTIGQYAFQNCASVHNLVIPDYVTDIGKGSLKGMNSLESLSIPFTGTSRTATDNNAVFGVIFDGSSNIPASLERVCLTNSTSINSAAFKNCRSIKILEVSKKVNSVGKDAFYGCSSIKIYGQPDSQLEVYCNNNGIEFNSFKAITEVNVIQNPDVPQYVGRPINYSGFTVECKCYDQSVETIETGFVISGELTQTSGNAITVSYEEFEKTLEIDAVGIESISISNPFTKREYLETERIDPAGLSLNVLYKNGVSFNLTEGYIIEDDVVRNLPDGIVTIYYGGFSITAKFIIKHQFEYHYNNDATYESDGTETEICSICGKTGGTRTKDGSKINPTPLSKISVKSDEVYQNSNVTVKAKVTNVPEGYYLAVYDGGNVPAVIGDNKSVSYEIKNITSNVKLTFKVIDKNGIVQKNANGKELSETIEVKVKTGFINAIIAFFKKLFKSNTVTIEP